MPTKITELNFQKHYYAKNSKYICEIVKPIKLFGINFFNHFRIYEDNSGIDLTTAPNFCEYFAREHLYRKGGVGRFNEYHDGYFFWDTLEGASDIFKAIEAQCGVSHGIVIVKKSKHFCDLFYLAGDKENPGIRNFFISHKELIEKFISYYYEKAAKIIKNASKYTYCFPDDRCECDELMNPIGMLFKEEIGLHSPENQFLNYFNCLTKREEECIYYLSKGMPTKQIADCMNISKRTVDRHLENTRLKLGTKNKVALLRMVGRLNLEMKI